MSSALAIAAVTAVIKDQIHNGFISSGLPDILGDVTISTLPPDKAANGNINANYVNVFLFMVSNNKGWQNSDLPARNSSGERIKNPPLVLDLHYLISAYGIKDFYSEIIFGSTMQTLHNTPVFGREIIRKALAPVTPPPDFPIQLISSNLDEQLEQIKITQQNLNIEEVTKLWSSFQTGYRLTASYLVTAVLIESILSTKSSLPVINRNIYVLPFNNPVIKKIISLEGENVPITPESTLIIDGQNFPIDNLKLFISGVDLSSSITENDKRKIILKFPDPLPEKIYSGIQVVQIVYSINMGTPLTPHTSVESNVEAFIMHPVIIVSLENSSTSVINGVTVSNGEIKITFTPKVNKNQKLVIYLNEFDPPSNRSARSYNFAAPLENGIIDPDTETEDVLFEFTNVIPGDYLIRARVDGTDSLLQQEDDINSIDFQKFINPKVSI